jgi:hypothetical protein
MVNVLEMLVLVLTGSQGWRGTLLGSAYARYYAMWIGVLWEGDVNVENEIIKGTSFG